MIKLDSSNYLQLFDHFELPDDIPDRLVVVSKLATLFCELQHQLMEITRSEFQNLGKKERQGGV